jgi:hypothetical protein
MAVDAVQNFGPHRLGWTSGKGGVSGRFRPAREQGSAAGLAPPIASARMEHLMTIRLLTITTVLSTMASVAAYAGYGTAGGAGWNQVAADAAARYYAAQGKCYPVNGPCAAPPILHPYRPPHAAQQHKRQLH